LYDNPRFYLENTRVLEQISRVGSMVMRQQRPRGTTTKEAVVSAALDVVDRVGVRALTIRAVARRVGSPPMSLYTHFSNKEELIDLMYGEVARRLYADAGQDTWQKELLALGHQVRSVLLQHPRWTPLLSRPAPPTAVGARERLLRMMTDAGKTPETALRALSSTVLVAVGLALVELTFRDPEGDSSFGKRFDRLKTWFENDVPALNSPVAKAAFSKMPRLDFSDTFDFTIRALIGGMGAPVH
jgi:AcrR family transcriptional regulator